MIAGRILAVLPARSAAAPELPTAVGRMGLALTGSS